MEVKVGMNFKVNTSSGEVVTVLYVPKNENNLLLLRESGNVIRANGVYFKSGYIYWNGGAYGHNEIFKLVYNQLDS